MELVTGGAFMTLLLLVLIRFSVDDKEELGWLGVLYITRIPWFDQTFRAPETESPEEFRYDMLAAVWGICVGILLLYTMLPTVGFGLVAASIFAGVKVNPESTLRTTAALIIIFSACEYHRVRTETTFRDWYQLP